MSWSFNQDLFGGSGGGWDKGDEIFSRSKLTNAHEYLAQRAENPGWQERSS